MVWMVTGGCVGESSEIVDDIVSMTSKLRVSSEEGWEENEEAASSFGELSLSREEANGVWSKQPWIFNRGLLLLEKWPREIAGEIQEIQWINENKMFLNGYVRMKIGFPLKQSIYVGRYIPYGGRRYWIQLKFERLPTLCFACGLWGHEKRDCHNEVLMEKSEGGQQVPKNGDRVGERLTDLENSDGHVVVAPPALVTDREEAPIICNHVTVKGSGAFMVDKSPIVGDGNKPINMPGGIGEENSQMANLGQVGLAGVINHNGPHTLGQSSKENATKINRAATVEIHVKIGDSTLRKDTVGTESEAKKRKNGGKDGEVEEERDRRALTKGKQILSDQENRARNHGKGMSMVSNANSGVLARSLVGMDSTSQGKTFVFGSEDLLDRVVGKDFFPWTLTCFYGHPDATQRKFSWELLRNIKEEVHGSWLCIGDFDEVVSLSEKVGGRIRRDVAMEDFRKVIDDCSLIDFCSSKTDLTWCNGHEVNPVMERLDRGLCNEEWLQNFDGADILVLDWWESDHRPLVVEMPIVAERERCGKVKRKSRFHFEEAWCEEPECGEIVERVWNNEEVYLKLVDESWDKDFIRAVFNMEDAELILSMPSMGWELEDKIMWHYSKNDE
ncbi:hypothetical protein G4B88_027842 [Cannabis sativa]|uniref:CCHC-type domain-containing protein n=1 Tax=Cannabis sativa TaxID=3483 RepID=A0A7J6I7Q6_CANSA|nr:hypothetical protein G4B88_027842 [Cannabis sativa]